MMMNTSTVMIAIIFTMMTMMITTSRATTAPSIWDDPLHAVDAVLSSTVAMSTGLLWNDNANDCHPRRTFI